MKSKNQKLNEDAQQLERMKYKRKWNSLLIHFDMSQPLGI